MQDTFEVQSGAIDWIFEPRGYAASPTLFVTHIILEVAEANKANGSFKVYIQKKTEDTDTLISACFATRNISKNSTEKTVHFFTPMPLTSENGYALRLRTKQTGQQRFW